MMGSVVSSTHRILDNLATTVETRTTAPGSLIVTTGGTGQVRVNVGWSLAAYRF
jgi:hypothetical protein